MSKNWKLMERGINGDNYFIMAAAFDDEEFTNSLQDGDRLFAVDEQKTYVWFNGSTFEDADDSAVSAAAASSSAIPALESPLNDGDDTHPIDNPTEPA